MSPGIERRLVNHAPAGSATSSGNAVGLAACQVIPVPAPKLGSKRQASCAVRKPTVTLPLSLRENPLKRMVPPSIRTAPPDFLFRSFHEAEAAGITARSACFVQSLAMNAARCGRRSYCGRVHRRLSFEFEEATTVSDDLTRRELDLPRKFGEYLLTKREVFYGTRKQIDAGVSAWMIGRPSRRQGNLRIFDALLLEKTVEQPPMQMTGRRGFLTCTI